METPSSYIVSGPGHDSRTAAIGDDLGMQEQDLRVVLNAKYDGPSPTITTNLYSSPFAVNRCSVVEAED